MFSGTNAFHGSFFEGGNASYEAGTPTLESIFCRQPAEKLEAGEALFWEGDQARHLFEITEGVLRIFKIIADGRRVITGFMYPGDLVGVSLKDRFLYSAEAVTAVKFRRFTRKSFQDEMNRCPHLRPLLFARLCDEMAAAQDQMVLLSRKSAEERLCSFFLLLMRRRSEHDRAAGIVQLPMTRLDIADYLGLTIETVSRTMTKLMGRGVVSASGRHAIKIARPAQLALLAGDSDEYDSSLPACADRSARH